nr:copalyl diphosphate synthase 2 [Tripterygium wilfordii]
MDAFGDVVPETLENSIEAEAVKIKEQVDNIKSFLGSIEDGDMSSSAYDIAWVAMIEDVNQKGVPQFPSCLLWIVENQLDDGSWGYSGLFSAYDRTLNTLACVIALKSWNIHPEKCEKGLSFLRENISLLEKEKAERMLGGFELVFPPLIEMARRLDIEVPDCSSTLPDICAKRNLKLTRIPKDRMHSVPTTILYSLEGIQDLDWEKILKLQCHDGSFLTSPSSTAFAYMKTKDENCFTYLKQVTKRFNGAVPSMHPIDLYERLWAVDRLRRLGISRFFEGEIKEYMSFVQRYWTKDGMSWTRNSQLRDTDCTAMGFRLLRLHGYQVFPDVFQNSKKGNEFICYEGQWNEAISVMSNLYRASQLMFPNEKILEEAKQFTSKFLREKQASNQLIDKWILTTDLSGEVAFALDVPWYACFPRLEARFYIEQYGAEDVVWIAKTLYSVPYIDNNMYLELAKLDYNNCQALHRVEWISIQMWYEGFEFGGSGVNRRSLLCAYFVAAASIFEQERSMERLAWVKTAILIETVASYFINSTKQRRKSFVNEFRKCVRNERMMETNTPTTEKLIQAILETLNQFCQDIMVTEDIVTRHLHGLWEKWLLTWQEEGNRLTCEAELLAQTINFMAGYKVFKEFSPLYVQLINITNRICSQLGRHQERKNKNGQDSCNDNPHRITTPQIERDMQELVQLVLINNSSDGDGMDVNMKQTFPTIAKIFYYIAFMDPETVNSHIAKVLFERVD